MSTAKRSSLWFIPQTTIGKALLGLYLISLFAVSLPLYDIAFDNPELLGPMPEAAAWTYLWFGVMNLVLIGTYYGLFKPWAEQATQYMGGWDEPQITDSVEEVPPTTTQSAEGSDD